jgi:hypothetical protein
MGFTVGMFGIIAGWILVMFGFLALYSYLANGPLERLAFIGLILSLAGVGLILPFMGVLTYIFPVGGRAYLEGQEGIIELLANGLTSSPLALGMLLVSSVIYTAGSIILGITIWRSGTLPKWLAVPYAVHAPLIPLGGPFFLIEFLGTILLLMSGVGIAYSIRRQWPTAIARRRIAHP